MFMVWSSGKQTGAGWGYPALFRRKEVWPGHYGFASPKVALGGCGRAKKVESPLTLGEVCCKINTTNAEWLHQ